MSVDRPTLLGFIAQNPGSTTREIANSLKLHVAQTNATLQYLYARSMIQRRDGVWFPLATNPQ